MTTETFPNSLEACHELILQLQEENLQLRLAGDLFGRLAERLNHELRVERSLYASDGAHELTAGASPRY